MITPTVHLICNAHLDPAWQWDWQSGAAEALSTFRTAADLCEEFPRFRLLPQRSPAVPVRRGVRAGPLRTHPQAGRRRLHQEQGEDPLEISLTISSGAHGSHNAPMPKPGLLIGCLNIAGIVEKCGEAESVFMIRGNLGEDYYLTTDRVFVDILTKDCRIPDVQKPEDEASLRAVSVREQPQAVIVRDIIGIHQESKE